MSASARDESELCRSSRRLPKSRLSWSMCHCVSSEAPWLRVRHPSPADRRSSSARRSAADAEHADSQRHVGDVAHGKAARPDGVGTLLTLRGVLHPETLAVGPFRVETPVKFLPFASFFLPLLARAVADVKREFFVHVAAVEMPERRPGQLGHHLTAGAIGINHRLVAADAFRQAGAFAGDDRARRSSMELGIGRVEPGFADALQTRDLRRDEVAGRERCELMPDRRRLRELGEPFPARPEKVANEIVVLDQFMRAEASIPECFGGLHQASRAFAQLRPLLATVLEVLHEVAMPLECDRERTGGAEVVARRQQPVRMDLLEGVVIQTGGKLLSSPGPWSDLFIGQPSGIHMIEREVGLVGQAISRLFSLLLADRDGDRVATGECGEALPRDELQHGPPVEDMADVPYRPGRSLASTLLGHVLPVVAIA